MRKRRAQGQQAVSGAFLWVFLYAFRSPLWRGLDNLSRLPCRKSLKSSSEIHFQVALMVKAFIFQAVALLLICVACRMRANVLLWIYQSKGV